MDNPSRLFVSGIPVRVDKQGIMDFFSQFGAIKYCKIKKNSKTGRSLGYAYITFEDPVIAQSLVNRQIEFEGRICECREVVKKEELLETMELERKKKLLVYELHPKVTNEILLEQFQKLTSVSHAYVLKDPESEFNKGYGYVAFPTQEALQEFVKRRPVIHILGYLVRYSDHMKTPPKRRRPQKPVQTFIRGDPSYDHSSMSKISCSNSVLPLLASDTIISSRSGAYGFGMMSEHMMMYPPQALCSLNSTSPAEKFEVNGLQSPHSETTTLGGVYQDSDKLVPSKHTNSKLNSSSEDSEGLINLSSIVEQNSKPSKSTLYSPWGWSRPCKLDKISKKQHSQNGDLQNGTERTHHKMAELEDQIFDGAHSVNGSHFIKPTNLGYSRIKRVDERTMILIQDFFAAHQEVQENYKYNGLTKVAYVHGSAAVND